MAAPGPSSESYERAVARGYIPTRDRSWHDVFNVLTFIRYPRAKRALHARVLELQQGRLARGQRGKREPEEDALTILDEAVLLIIGSTADLEVVREIRQRGDLEGLHREILGRGLHVSCFGHALLEHVQLGRRPIGAGVLEVTLEGAEDSSLEPCVDARLAEMIETRMLDTPCYTPTLMWPGSHVDSWAGPVLY